MCSFMCSHTLLGSYSTAYSNSYAGLHTKSVIMNHLQKLITFIYYSKRHARMRQLMHTALSGPYLTFLIWGANLVAEVEDMATPQLFILGGSGGMLPQKVLGVLRHILVHSEAYREAHRASWEEAHHYHHHLLSYWNWKPSLLAPCPRGYTERMRNTYTPS